MADSAAVLVPRVELAYRHLGLPADRPGRLATARAGAALVEALRRAGSRVHLVETLARTALPATDTAVANSLSRAPAVASAVDAFRWDRLGPLRAAEDQADERGRAAASTLTALREAVGADEFATRLGPALLGRRRRGSSTGSPRASAPNRCRLRQRAARTTCPSTCRRRRCLARPAGRATRAKGAPASEVLGPLQAFLDAHRDEQVVVEWRVQE